MLKTETFTYSLHVHLNKLQNQITLRSLVNNRMQEIKWACKLIYIYLIETNHFISHFSVIKKVVLLNAFIHEDTKIQFKRKWFNFLMMLLTSECVAIA